MRGKNVHKLIEKQDEERKEIMYVKFQRENGLRSQSKVVKFNKTRIRVASIAAAAMAICLIIAIPLLIGNMNKAKKRYFTVSDCAVVELNQNLKDYAASINKDFLYIDWYDIAEDVKTKLIVDKNNKDDIIYIEEFIANGETGDLVYLYILDESTTVDSFTLFDDSCIFTATINNISVYWFYSYTYSVASFNYNGNKYYIQLQDPIEEDSVLGIVEEMLT